jgi:hypothetical protein
MKFYFSYMDFIILFFILFYAIVINNYKIVINIIFLFFFVIFFLTQTDYIFISYMVALCVTFNIVFIKI